MFGVVLTQAHSFDEFRTFVKKNTLDTIKVVTAWGLSWEDQRSNNRALICSLTPNTVVRTKSGDPSYLLATRHPIPDYVVQEIEPWYRCKRDIIIEIGNEPNLFSSESRYFYEYRWYLLETIKVCRRHFPLARIMSTALQPDYNVQAWFSVFNEKGSNVHDVVDYVGVHAYEHTTFLPNSAYAQTRHLQKIEQMYAPYKDKLFFSELGINGVSNRKLQEYRVIGDRYPTTYYHYVQDEGVDSQYHIS